jgi:hypothetical protein
LRPHVTSVPTVALSEILKPVVVISCIGKIREVTRDQVTASLFSEEGEIVGEFLRNQFSGADPRVGQVFRYEAIVTAPGKTEVSIAGIPESSLPADEVVELWKEVDKQLPRDEY